MDAKKFQKILSKAQKLSVPDIERNVFQLGARGHYENPTSDLLLFFINPYEEHTFKDLVFSSLLNCLRMKEVNVPEIDPFSTTECKRELSADDKRLDILIIGANWTISIENKIRHSLNNPLTIYKNYVINEFKKPTNIFILLSHKHYIAQENWTNILYKDLVKEIKNQFGKYFLDSSNASNVRWAILLREFIINIEQEIGDKFMNEETYSFVKNNFNDISKLINLRQEFFDTLSKKCEKVVRDININGNVSTSFHNWKTGYAIKTYSGNWMQQTNIALALFDKDNFQVRIYVYGFHAEEIDRVEKLKTHFQDLDFWPEGNGNIQCFGSKKFEELESCFPIIQELTHRLNKFFEAK